jgi:hypothetical protein
MTVGVIKGDNDSMRIRIEKIITADLKNIGYNAVSAFEEFGAKGLSNLGQQETYRKLCTQGIDAVIVITLIDRAKENQFRTQKSYVYPDNYYYDRIWSYKNIQADLSEKIPAIQDRYFWEAILFNLGTLEAECTIQSSSFRSPDNNIDGQFEKQVVRKMIKEKILEKQNVKTLKAFKLESPGH